MITNRTITTLLIAICLWACPLLAICQPGSFDDNVSDVPMDGGLSLLLVSGAAYAARKLGKPKNKEHAQR